MAPGIVTPFARPEHEPEKWAQVFPRDKRDVRAEIMLKQKDRAGRGFEEKSSRSRCVRYGSSVHAGPGLAAAEYAAEGTTLNAQAVVALERDR